jgi:hypothetical protein
MVRGEYSLVLPALGHGKSLAVQGKNGSQASAGPHGTFVSHTLSPPAARVQTTWRALHLVPTRSSGRYQGAWAEISYKFPICPYASFPSVLRLGPTCIVYT